MKKFFKSIFAIVLCVCTLFAFTACGNGKLSKTTVSTEGVVSNGGISVYHNGWIYFVNGTKTNNADNNKSKVVQGGIYRVKTNEKGEIIYKETTNEKGEAVKEFDTVEAVVNRLVGFKDGSITIIGDFLYYATPCRDKNKKGEMLFDRTEFRRYDLKTKKDQHIYTATESSETITYGFYKEGENLDLVVFEKKSATLKSIRIGDKMKTLFTKNDVTSAVLSDNFGESKIANVVTDNYIFYTKSYEQDSEIQKGVRVYKILANGTEESKISEGEDVSLLTIKAGKLIYAKNSRVYASEIAKGANTLKFEISNTICYENYDNIIFIEDAGNSVLVCDDLTLRIITWENNVMKNTNLFEFDSNDKVAFIGTEGDYVYFTNNKIVYKSKYKNFEDDEDKIPVQLSTTKMNDASDLIALEVNNGYIYGMYTDSKASLTYLYRINTLTPRERDDKDDKGVYKEIGEAEFIGVKE